MMIILITQLYKYFRLSFLDLFKIIPNILVLLFLLYSTSVVTGTLITSSPELQYISLPNAFYATIASFMMFQLFLWFDMGLQLNGYKRSIDEFKATRSRLRKLEICVFTIMILYVILVILLVILHDVGRGIGAVKGRKVTYVVCLVTHIPLYIFIFVQVWAFKYLIGTLQRGLYFYA